MRHKGKPPVILQIVPSLGPGGAEQSCIDVAAAIARAGGKAIVVSKGGARVPELRRLGVSHIDLPVDSKNPLTMARNIGRLRKIIRRETVDIVHARSRAPAWSGWFACKNTRAHFVTTCHAPYNFSGEWKKRYNGIMARGERVIANSHFVADYLRKHYDVNAGDIRIIPRGAALEKFHPAAVTPERLIALSQAWRIPEGSNIVMLPGRLTRWKGQSVAIEAMGHLKRRDVFCLIVGSDQGRTDYREDLETLIREQNLEGRVRIVDHCDDMPAAYMLATIVLSPSVEPEGFGRVAVEGQAMGRMVIASDHGGSKETVLHGQTGWLVPPGDAKALAAAMKTALELPPQQRAALAAEAMSHVARHFTREAMTAATLAVYAELLPPQSLFAGHLRDAA